MSSLKVSARVSGRGGVSGLPVISLYGPRPLSGSVDGPAAPIKP